MAGFLSPLRVERLDGSKWKVLEDFEYCVGAADSNIIIDVPAGFITDFGSVPKAVWNLIPPVGGPCDKAYVIHDMLYQYPYVQWTEPVEAHLISRGYADSVLNEAMQVLNVGRLLRWSVYTGVRVGGWKAWDGYRAREKG